MYTSIFPYAGGKTRLKGVISNTLEIAKDKFHLTGVLSVCGGSAKELLALEKNWDWILYNEMDSGVAAIFYALSTEATAKKMIELAKKSPYTYEDYQENKNLWEQGYPGLSLVEKAARTYTLIMQSYRGILGRCLFTKITEENRLDYEKKRQEFYNKLEQLTDCREKISDWTITSGSCFSILEQCKARKDCIAYIDPPYVQESCKSSSMYLHGWTKETHEALVDLLLQPEMQLKIMLSGYDNSIYTRLKRSGWRKELLDTIDVPTSHNSGISSQADEYAWFNY